MQNEKKTVVCMNCGAPVMLTSSLCKYCKSPFLPEKKLTPDDREKLSRVVSAMEESLSAAEGNNWIPGLAFFVFSGLAMGSYFLYSRLFDSAFQEILFTILTAGILFILFGFVVTIIDKKTTEKTAHAQRYWICRA